MTTLKKLAKLFQITGESEQSLEFARQNLCKASAFEPYASFQRLDRLSKGYLTPRDFLNFLKDNGIDTADEFDAKLLINYFDATGEGRLFYTEAACTQRPTYPVGPNEYLPFDVERLLAKLVQKELKLARDAERIKQELASRYDYSLDRLFKDVDDINYNYVDQQNLKRFLIKCGVFPNEATLISILRRFDLDADAKLNKKEFIEGVKPSADDFSKRQTNQKQTLASSRVFSPKSSQKNKSFRSSSKDEENRGNEIRSPTQTFRAKSSLKKKRSSNKSHAKLGESNGKADYTSFQERREEQHDANQVSQLIRSPSQNNYNTAGKENSPLRMKYLQSQNQLLTSHFDGNKSGHHNTLSPGASRLNESLHKSRLNESQFTSSRADLRSPQRDNEEGEACLIYLIRNCFRDLLAIESGLELAKKELALRPDFTLAGAFNFFTGYSQDRLSSDEIFQGFERLGVVCDISDVKLYVERYDADRDNKLGFWEFSNSLLPVETIVRDDLERRRAQFDLSYETKELLRRTFRKLIDAETMIENLRQRIAREQSVSLRKAFDQIDWLGRGFLTNNEFKRSFENYGQRMSSASLSQSIVLRQDQIELESLIRRFNKDKLNGRVSLPEFLEELTPKNPSKVY
ncbi:ef hand family protein [Stylonychia lemnae]|uniref:Ef hand family protein n=1 Tax=Stylonychia lemnae TaxID=5949 RepID=A0A078AYI1_STYLE|nr:ef hand family protein [Stylonychia lemnae]|eukprot:CDW85848.1 ef hand family protein [Stylonychia lemnae]